MRFILTMRNVNDTKLPTPLATGPSFILTMRNVNFKMTAYCENRAGGFILTMRNVNQAFWRKVEKELQVLY